MPHACLNIDFDAVSRGYRTRGVPKGCGRNSPYIGSCIPATPKYKRQVAPVSSPPPPPPKPICKSGRYFKRNCPPEGH
ncbi:hypothetical protein TorRG33x02_107980 [Trema orientale]|uniref:Uncharacterized protein n=1 Tax=Trema orientale TaxID=63057 RepID=A0A2P5F6V4_TREOI|nr:hypothetical protein TorRG33x02_107980 [Trema orientale]